MNRIHICIIVWISIRVWLLFDDGQRDFQRSLESLCTAQQADLHEHRIKRVVIYTLKTPPRRKACVWVCCSVASHPSASSSSTHSLGFIIKHKPTTIIIYCTSQTAFFFLLSKDTCHTHPQITLPAKMSNPVSGFAVCSFKANLLDEAFCVSICDQRQWAGCGGVWATHCGGLCSLAQLAASLSKWPPHAAVWRIRFVM